MFRNDGTGSLVATSTAFTEAASYGQLKALSWVDYDQDGAAWVGAPPAAHALFVYTCWRAKHNTRALPCRGS